MRDSRARAGKWKRLKRANGILGKRMVNQTTRGFTRTRVEKERIEAAGGDAVAGEGGVGAKVRATIPQQTKIRPLLQTPGQRQTRNRRK